MKLDMLHITSGDCAGSLLEQTGLERLVLVWRNILYDKPRRPGWPDQTLLKKRDRFLENEAGGVLDFANIMETLTSQYKVLADIGTYDRVER